MTNSPRPHCSLRKLANAFVIVLALIFPASLAKAQQLELQPQAPPALPGTSHSSQPVQPGSVPLAAFGEEAANPLLSSSTWMPIGPASLQSGGGLVSGRLTGIAVDPTDSSTIYLAAAGGGVWKTSDGGATWAPLTDNQTTLAMGAIAIAPTDRLKIYAGTGEANNSADSNHGNGILVSNDGGATWSLATAGGAFTGIVIGQIAVDPTNENVAYAAVGGYPGNGQWYVNTGIWKTSDGGANWTNVTAAASLSTQIAWTAVVVDPNTPSIIYAAMGDINGQLGVNGVYRSTDHGSTWAKLTGAPSGSSTGRFALAVSRAANSAGHHVLYVAVAKLPPSHTSNGGLYFFGRSDNADAAAPTFTNLTSGTPDFLGGENGGGQGWYDIAVNVDANGVVYCAGVENYGGGGTQNIIRSVNLGVNWSDISIVGGVQPHTDSHAIAFDSTNRMLIGNDGGIWRYDSTVPNWTDLNSNLNTIQFTGVGLHPSSVGTVVGGSQDNGTELYSGSLTWTETDGGDGGYAQISPTQASRCYAIHPVGSFGPSAFFRRSDSGCAAGTWMSEASGFVNTNSNFYPPFTLDRTNGDHLLIGLDRVYESTSAAAVWTAISAPGSNGFNSAGNNVDSVALAPANSPNPQVLYAATGGEFASTSKIFVSNNDGATWTERDLPVCPTNANISEGCRVNQIVTDPNDSTGQTAIAVTSNFTAGGQHAYRTTNAGATWTDISGNLPNLPTWSVQVDTDASHTIYISNDTGVFSSPSPYTSWAVYGAGLPNAQGADLELNSNLHVLAVATHGRGAWEIATPNTPAAIISPAPGSTLTGSSTTFTWNAVTGASQYYLWIGTTPGGTDLAQAGTSGTSYTVSLPTNGATIYVRLYTQINGQLQYNSYTYTEYMPVPAAMISPVPASTLNSGSTTFTWSAGTGVSYYYLWIGTTPGGTDLAQAGMSGTSYTANLPSNGATIYVRLYSVINNTLQYKDYSYIEAP